MRPHLKQDRVPLALDRDGEACEREKPGRRRRSDPLRYERSGYFTEYWDSRRGRWRLISYFRDWDSMIRSRRAGRNDWDIRPVRIRYPGDGKWNEPPAHLRYSSYREVPVPRAQPEPVSEKFVQRVSAAIDGGLRAKLVYEDRNDARTVRVVRPLRWVEGDRFTAFCELRGEERDFRVHRILDCQMVEG